MLASWEKDMLVYRAMYQAAEQQQSAPTCEDIAEILDTGDGGPPPSSTVLVVQRLERRALIHVQRFQRARIVTITETGKQTAEPSCKTPHWRDNRKSSNI